MAQIQVKAMVKKVWKIKLEDGRHTVKLEYSGTFGKIKALLVDGKSVKHKRKLTYRKSEHPFKIGKHDCVIVLKSSLTSYKSDLLVDGRLVKVGRRVSKSIPMPKWAWAFIAACVAIPIVSLGGAIPAGIGGGGAIACAIIAKDSSKTKRKRVAMCLGVTAICWVLFILTIVGIAFLIRGG